MKYIFVQMYFWTQSRITSLESQTSNLESRSSNLESLISNLDSLFSTLESLISNLKSRIMKLESRLERYGLDTFRAEAGLDLGNFMTLENVEHSLQFDE